MTRFSSPQRWPSGNVVVRRYDLKWLLESKNAWWRVDWDTPGGLIPFRPPAPWYRRLWYRISHWSEYP